jgi:hypothetical protein
MTGIYRGETQMMGLTLIKYQIARSSWDAMRRASKFDDPCWLGVRFKFIERCAKPMEGWTESQQIITSRH